MAIKIDTTNGFILMDETTGEILTPEVLRQRAREFALAAGINPDIFEAQINQESGFNPNAYNPSGATGIAQIVPKWHPGVDANDPIASLEYAANLMASHLANYGGDYSKALAAYNAGPGAVASGAAFTYPETQNYISSILGAVSSNGGGGSKRLFSVGASPNARPDDEPPRRGGTTPDSTTGQKRVRDVTNLGNGKYQYEYTDGTFEIVDTSTGESNTVSASTAASIAENRRQFDLSYANAQTPAERQRLLGENHRQFDETMGFEKAKYDQNYALERGKTLLGLGSRPDTLIKYLYALRGQQTPQGFGNTTANLPGFQNVLGTNNGAAPSAAPAPAPVAAPVSATAAPVADPRVAAVTQAISAGGANLAPFVAPGGGNVTQMQPPGGINSPTQGAQDALIAQGRVPRFFNDGVAIFGDGGPIPEPVIGQGLFSGQQYIFGENGPETVVPQGKTLADVKSNDPDTSRDPMGGTSVAAQRPSGQTSDIFPPLNLRMTGVNSYASGGTIGYADPYAGLSGFGQNGMLRLSPTDPDAAGLMAKYPGRYEITSPQAAAPYLQSPTPAPAPGIVPPTAIPPRQFAQAPGPAPAPGGFAPPSLFNPPGLAGNISGPVNPNGNPNFPQFDYFTGGGKSLVPSMQKLTNSMGSERDLYSGFLQDEAGVQSQDVFDLARQLAPKVTGLRTPRYA